MDGTRLDPVDLAEGGVTVMTEIISVISARFTLSSQTATLPAMSKTPSQRRSPEADRLGVSNPETMLELARLRYQLWGRLIDGGRVAVWIVAAWIPLTAVARTAHYIAGKKTQFTATVSVTIAISICISVGWTVTAVRSHERKREIDRLRGRNDDLERRLLALERQQETPFVGPPQASTTKEATE
jgi:hypothetical protein